VSDSIEAGSRRFDLPERREQLELLSRTLDREAHAASKTRLSLGYSSSPRRGLRILHPCHRSLSPIRSAGLNCSWARAAFSAS